MTAIQLLQNLVIDTSRLAKNDGRNLQARIVYRLAPLSYEQLGWVRLPV
jgi:hypothetical protein